MLVVVEGMDRCGKSSLCETFKARHGGEILHFSAPQQDAIDEYVAPLRGYVPGEGQNLYLDRHYLGETIWPRFFGRRSRMTRVERECVEAFLESRGALCVLAQRDPEELERVCAAEGEPSAGRAAEAQRMFVDSSQRSLVPWWYYEHGDDVDELVVHARELETWAAERRVSAWS